MHNNTHCTQEDIYRILKDIYYYSEGGPKRRKVT